MVQLAESHFKSPIDDGSCVGVLFLDEMLSIILLPIGGQEGTFPDPFRQ